MNGDRDSLPPGSIRTIVRSRYQAAGVPGVADAAGLRLGRESVQLFVLTAAGTAAIPGMKKNEKSC